MHNNQIRQGDVFLTPAENVPAKGKKLRAKNGRLILARGEATSHHHSVSANTSELFELDGRMWLVVNEPTTLDHQEHAPIEIQPGTYWVVRQREYHPQEIRRVQD